MDNIKRKKEKINTYKKFAEIIKNNLYQKKRPLIVEFAGLPKSGKTTVVNSLALFLRRNDIPCIVVKERASVCPINNKQHPDFNLWTSLTTLTNILNYKHSDKYFVIIVDRGIFDALVWLNLLNKIDKLNDSDLEQIEKFFLMKRWMKMIDLVISMKADVKIALDREFKDLLTDKGGRIMNHDFLTKLLEELENSTDKYKNYFKEIITMDTSSTNTIEGVEKVVSKVLERLESLSDEELVLIPKESYDKRINLIGFSEERKHFKTLERIVKNEFSLIKRSIAENETEYIQLISCVILKHKNKIAVFTKIEDSEKKRLHNKQMIWVGGHLQCDDVDELKNLTLNQSLINCLKRELDEELQLEITKRPTYKGLVYSTTHPKSIIHLGIVYEYEINDDFLVKSLDQKTIIERTGKGSYVEFISLNQETISSYTNKIEPWSVAILKSLYGIKIPANKSESQLFMF